MTKKIFAYALSLMLMLGSCGSQKKVAANNYYSEPQAPVSQPTLKKREIREVDKLVDKETDKMRAVGLGNSYDEKLARKEAIRDGQATLTGYLESSIVSLVQDYHKNAAVNGKKYSESNTEGLVETAVSQKVSTKIVGVPEVYDAADGTVQVYVCVELQKPTNEIIGEVYDQLTKDDVLGSDYDKMKFIQDNKDRLQELRDKVN